MGIINKLNNKIQYLLMQDSFCCCCGIEYNFLGFDTPTEKAYQINNGLDDTLQDM